jgi:hypothetical protein
MLVDWLLWGLIIWGLAFVLNKTAFKAQPASKGAAWGLTILIFLLSIVALSAAKVIRYQAIFDNVGVPISPRNPLDMGGAFVFAWLFYSFINTGPRKATSKAQPPHSTSTLDGLPVMTLPLQRTSSPNTVDEDLIYALIAEELEAGLPEKGLWTRLFAECGGDEKQTQVLYIKQRAQRLITAECLRFEQAQEASKPTEESQIEGDEPVAGIDLSEQVEGLNWKAEVFFCALVLFVIFIITGISF